MGKEGKLTYFYGVPITGAEVDRLILESRDFQSWHAALADYVPRRLAFDAIREHPSEEERERREPELRGRGSSEDEYIINRLTDATCWRDGKLPAFPRTPRDLLVFYVNWERPQGRSVEHWLSLLCAPHVAAADIDRQLAKNTHLFDFWQAESPGALSTCRAFGVTLKEEWLGSFYDIEEIAGLITHEMRKLVAAVKEALHLEGKPGLYVEST